MDPWRGNHGRKPAEQREGIHFDGVRAITEGLAEGYADETIRQQAEAFLGQGRAKHVLAQGFSARSVLGASMGCGVQREPELCDRKGSCHFDAGVAT
jgi:hypothetical protein